MEAIRLETRRQEMAQRRSLEEQDPSAHQQPQDDLLGYAEELLAAGLTASPPHVQTEFLECDDEPNDVDDDADLLSPNFKPLDHATSDPYISSSQQPLSRGASLTQPHA